MDTPFCVQSVCIPSLNISEFTHTKYQIRRIQTFFVIYSSCVFVQRSSMSEIEMIDSLNQIEKLK